MRRRPENMWNKVQRFSIRKFSFGVTSALVGTFFLANASMVHASSVEKEAGTQPNQLEINKATEDSQKENKVEVKKEKPVEKNNLSEAINQLTDILTTVNKDKVSKSSLLQFETALSEAKSVLQNESATQEEVDSIVRSLKSTISIVKSMPKLSASSDKKEKKNIVPQKETVETPLSKVQEEVSSPKTQEEKNASLKQIQKDLQKYLTVVGEKENKENKETKIEEAKSILANITTQLENPTLNSEELTVLLKQASQVRNSIVNEVLRENTGARDSRNGNKIEEGSHNRAASISPTWDSGDNLLIYQRHRASDGSRVVRNGLTEYTEKKVDMFAKTTTIGGERYVVYDVFFNNDGVSMAHLSRYQIYRLILPPQILDLNGNGTYKSNTLRDLKFETYTRNGNSGTLSQNPENFTRTASHNVNFLNNSTDYGSGWRKLTYFNALDIRHGNSYNQDMSETFKGNSNDPLLIYAVTRPESKFNQYSYGFGVKTEDRDSAIHMQVKAKLKAGVTDDQVREAFALAVVGTFGLTTNQAYTFISGKDANEPKYTDYPDQPVQPTLREKQAKLYPIQGSRHTKVVGDTILNTGNPVADKYITRKGSGDFPAGMSWSWKDSSAPSTVNAGKFTYTAIARYQDNSTSEDANSGSDGKVYFTVNPKKPTITTSVVNKKGLTNQTIEVNVGSGVKNGSVVKLYDGDRVIGQGTSNGTTARVTVSGALPGNPLKAETTVDNGGVVISEKSDPVTPTEAPDTQAPTLAITPANQTVVEGQTVTFTVTARDNKIVNLDTSDFITKYGSRLVNAKASATNVKNTDTEKIRTITITTTAEDVGKTNTITFSATDNANHSATPVSFTFTVTKRDDMPPTVKMTNPTDGNKTTVLTNNESTSPVTRIYRGATLNVPLSMFDNDPKGKVNLKYESGLPKGVNFNNGTTLSKTGAVENNPGTTTVTGTVAADAPLGKHTATFKVSDDQSGNVDRGNTSTVKFRTEVVDLEFEDGKGEVRQDGTLVVKGNKGTSLNDANEYLRTTDGTTHNDSFFPGGMKFRFIPSDNTVKNNVTFNTPGKHVVKAAAYFPENYAGTNGIQKVPRTGVTGDNVSEITNKSYLTKNIEVQIKPTAPTVTPETNGDVTVTPVNEENVNTFNFTYNDPNNTPKTVTATKTGNGWTLTNAPVDGVTIDPTTGKVTIKDRAIKDSDPVTAISKTTDNVESDPARANSNVGDKIPPVFTFTPNGKEKIVDATGKQVVYVTPTEDTNLNIGAVTDNSNKLVEAIFKGTDGNASGLGLPGLTHNGVLRANNVEVAAPRDIIVTGKVSEYKTGTTRWVDDELYTRNVNATDASNNSISNTREHPIAVTFKVLTQATKYDPHVGNQVIDKDITAPGATVTQAEFDAIKSNITFTSDRGDVKISNGANNRTAGLNITMNENGAIKQDPSNGSYYVNARIEYPDHSTENIRIPVTKSDTTAPKVTINGRELSETATDYSFVVFKGSTFNPTLRVSDDKNTVKSVSVSGLPSGNNFSATGNWSKNGADVQVTGDTITATNTAALGDHEASIVVKDALNNEKTYKFKYKVVDVAIKETPKTVPLNTQLGDSHNYVKVVDGTNNDGDDKYYPDGMSFKWKKGTAEVPNETRLSRPGIVSDYKPEVKFKSGAGFYTKTIDGKEVKVYTPTTIERDQVFRVKPTAPTITSKDDGDVTVTPLNEENVNRLDFTYVHPNNSTFRITATKNGNIWSLSPNTPQDGVTINPDTGVVTIKDRAIKDATEITAKSVTTDSVDSDTTTGNSKAGDKEPPVFTFDPDGKEKIVDAEGNQVVYVTPTEDTNLTIGRVTDNSGKLLESRIMEKNGDINNGLGFRGLSYNELIRRDNTEVEAPRNVNVTGKVSEYKTGTTPWNDSDDYTRYVIAKDTSTNELRNISDGINPTRVKFKVLTQATKYEPQVSAQPVNVDVNATSAKISQSDFDALKSNITFDSTRGPVKIDNTTTGLKISMKEEGTIKQNTDGSHYVGATIEYPDHSIDEIQIPVVKADANEPSATMDGMLLTKDENTTANFVVFKGAKFTPTFTVRDDRNKITNLKVTGLPNGTEIEKIGSWTSGTNIKIEDAANTSTDTATLGDHVGSVEVTDSTGNKGTYKYKYKVVDVEVRNSPETVDLGTKLVDAANVNNGKDSHNYVKVVDGQNNNGDDKYYPAGMNFKWSKNNAEITTTTEFNKPGVVTDYKALVKFSSGAGFYTKSIDGKTVKVYTPASIEKDVTFHVAPPKPTFNQDAVSSTTRTISGTLGGFTSDDRVVEVHLNDKDKTVLSSKDGQVTINGDTWTATLPDNVKLRQSENKNGETEKPLPITVVNKVGDTDVSKTSDPKVVTMGDYSPSATIAGSKHIDVTVPHDAKRIELRFHNSTDTDNTPNSIVLVRNENGGDWQVDPATPAGVTNANNFVQAITNSVNDTNKAENKVSITLKETDNNKKLLIKEEVASGDNTDNYTSGLGLRVDYKPEAGQTATPAGNWKVITVTNDAPVVTLKDATVGTQENPKVFTAGTTLTEDLLKGLVTVTDTEDDRTTDKPFGTGIVNITGLPENPTAGVYTVTLQPVDSQGKAGNQVTVHVVVKEEKPAAPTISQWQNGNVKVTPSTNNGGDKVTIPLTDGTVTLVKNGNDWQLETPKEGVVFRNGSLEIPKELVGTSVTAKASKGTGGSAVDSDDATYTPTPHKVTTVDVIKEAGSPLTSSDLSGTTGVTGVVDGTETKDFTAAKITSVVEKTSPLPNVTPDSKHTIPATITYEDGSTETTDVIVKVKPQAPTVTPKENGTVEITPILTGEGTTTITYTGEDNTPQTVTVTKAGDGTWTSSDPKITVDANGKVTIPADKVKDGSPVTAQVTSKTTDLTSQSSTETAGKPLTVEVGTPVDAIENKAYTSDKVVTPNKDNSTITPTPKNGLTVTPEGKVTGTPDIKDWGEIEENRNVTIKVTVTHEGDTPVEKDVVVNVLRDTDGDGTPDKDDLDDDNDGIPDDQDKNPKVADKLTGTVTPPAPVREKAEVPPVTVVTTNKPGATITTENPPVNGLSVNGNGELTGTPTVNDWGKDEEERQIKIPVKVTKEKDGKTGKETEEIKVEVPVTILRDTDGDGTPDKEDTDDDNDGIPDDEEKRNGTDPKSPTTQTPTIGITRKENGDAIVTPTKPGGGTYPPGTTVTIPGNDNTPIEVTIGNDGSGTVPNDKLPKTDKPGTGIVKEPNKEPSKPVNVTTPARKPSTIELEQDPKTGDVTVTPKKPDGTTYPPGTTVEIPGKNGIPIVVTIEDGGKGKVSNDDLPEDKTPGTGTITEKGKDPEDVKVETPKRIDPTLPETDAPTEIAITRKENGDAIVTPKKPGGGTYPPETKVEIPGEDGTTIEVTIGNDGSGTVPNDKLPKTDKPGTGTVTEPNKKPSQPVNVTTPARKTPTVELEQNPKTGDVTVTPKKPGGETYPPGTIVEIPGKDGNPIRVEIGQNGKGTVPNSELPDGNTPGTAKITEPNKPVENVNVETPARKTPTVELQQDPDTGEVTVTPKKPGGETYPPGTKVEIPGKNGTPIVVTIGEDGKGKVPNKDLPDGNISGPGTITEPGTGKTPEKVTVETPARLTPALVLDQDPNTGDVTVTPKKPDGSTYPPGTKVEIPGKNGNTITVIIGEDGKGTVPNSDLPDGEVPGTGKITEPGKPTVEVNVKTPKKLDPNAPQTEQPGEIEITRKPNGDAVVTPKKPDGSTYPPGTTVEIPGENGTTITVTIGDNGSGEVPNDNLPKKDVPGTGTVTEPNKNPSQPVEVTTPARKTPTVELEQNPKTGDVTVTPKRPDGSTYPPGTKIEIPGKNGNTITVTIGEDGKGTVPNSDLPDGKVPGVGKITEPGRPTEEVPNVETPARKTPTLDVEQDPKTGDVTVTPKRPDGSTYPPGTKVEIPGKDKDNPIVVIIGEDGKGKVPNKDLPDRQVPGNAKITEPGKDPVEVPVVTTPARKTPTVELEQDPNTGDVTVTPKKPDGSTYPPGTKVEIPGKNGTPIIVTIGEDGKGKVPNSELPEGKVPGTGKITEPAKPAVEVPVETPAKVTPTVELDQDPKTGDVTVTPKRPDGTTYPPGTKVEIPGKNGTPIVVIIGEDGKGKVPNSELPEGKVPGTGKITEPGKPTVEVPGVTTPGKFTPGTPVTPTTPETPTTEQPGKIEIHQKPNGDAVVTPKKPDGSTYPPGTKVEIPGENGTTIVVTIGDNGSGEVPNDKLPKKDIPGTGTVTEPNKRPSKPVDVTTPARKTPTSDLEQNPKTSDESETSKDNQTPAQETPATTGEPVQQTQDTNQNILPNTGTADGLGIFSAAVASILSGFGLVVFGKKEDEEEEKN